MVPDTYYQTELIFFNCHPRRSTQVLRLNRSIPRLKQHRWWNDHSRRLRPAGGYWSHQPSPQLCRLPPAFSRWSRYSIHIPSFPGLPATRRDHHSAVSRLSTGSDLEGIVIMAMVNRKRSSRSKKPRWIGLYRPISRLRASDNLHLKLCWGQQASRTPYQVQVLFLADNVFRSWCLRLPQLRYFLMVGKVRIHCQC